ncbi:SDR family NAD(P)-dependent oxidoreductase [Yoonia sp.]|uniref:SDR family NAD(P)-dependent oxidoreductase n=1 Tax=Yoonia sp. TaxID=2212373 RepID=UPI00391B1CA3
MPQPIGDSVVVITGASSGIGRAAASMFAEKGATVVLAARRAEALEHAATECRNTGANAMVIPIDVRKEDEVRDLAQKVIEKFGRIDVWVNNAAVALSDVLRMSRQRFMTMSYRPTSSAISTGHVQRCRCFANRGTVS